jgi:hypothetical protein
MITHATMAEGHAWRPRQGANVISQLSTPRAHPALCKFRRSPDSARNQLRYFINLRFFPPQVICSKGREPPPSVLVTPRGSEHVGVRHACCGYWKVQEGSAQRLHPADHQAGPQDLLQGEGRSAHRKAHNERFVDGVAAASCSNALTGAPGFQHWGLALQPPAAALHHSRAPCHQAVAVLYCRWL